MPAFFINEPIYGVRKMEKINPITGVIIITT